MNGFSKRNIDDDFISNMLYIWFVGFSGIDETTILENMYYIKTILKRLYRAKLSFKNNPKPKDLNTLNISKRLHDRTLYTPQFIFVPPPIDRFGELLAIKKFNNIKLDTRYARELGTAMKYLVEQGIFYKEKVSTTYGTLYYYVENENLRGYIELLIKNLKSKNSEESEESNNSNGFNKSDGFAAIHAKTYLTNHQGGRHISEEFEDELLQFHLTFITENILYTMNNIPKIKGKIRSNDSKSSFHKHKKDMKKRISK